MDNRTPARIERDRLMKEAQERADANDRRLGCVCTYEDKPYNEMEGRKMNVSPDCPLHKWMLEGR